MSSTATDIGARRGSSRGFDAAAWVAAATLVVGFAFVLYAGRHLGFFYDDWSFLLTRRSGGLSSLIDAQNGHPVVLLVATYRGIFELFGVDSYTPFRVAVALVHVISCGALYVLARRRIGPWAALAPMLLLLFLGAGYHDILWGIQVSYVGSIASGLIALALLDDRADAPPADGGRGRGADVLVCALLLISIAWSSIGIAFLAAVGVELLISARTRRRLWIAVVPVFFYALWWLAYGGEGNGEARAENVLKIPQYVLDSAAGSVAGIAGMPLTWAPALLLFAIAALAAARYVGRTSAPPLSPRLAGLTAGVLVNWTLTALTRAQLAEPAASRYVYVGAVFLLAIAVELLWPPRRDLRVAAVIAVLTGSAVLAGIGLMRDGERSLRGNWESVRASISALEVAGSAAPPQLQPEPQRAPQIVAGPYLASVDAIGSTPALSPAQLARQPESLRQHADAVLAQALPPRQEPLARVTSDSSSGAALVVDGVPGGEAQPFRDSCQRVVSPDSASAIDLAVAPGDAIAVASSADGPVDVRVRRFADAFPAGPTLSIAPRTPTRITFPAGAEAADRPWHVELSTPEALTVCPA